MCNQNSEDNVGAQYEYISRKTRDEQQVVNQGFPWVDTRRLLPGGELGFHQHHSRNTHLIIKGQMTLSLLAEGMFLTGDRTVKTYTEGELMPMPSNKCYRARAGPIGCEFVEGHKFLSPTTATRYENAGKIQRKSSIPTS